MVETSIRRVGKGGREREKGRKGVGGKVMGIGCTAQTRAKGLGDNGEGIIMG